MSKKLPKIGALVAVTWLDSARHADGCGWVQREEISNDTLRMLSVGWVWAINPTSITLAPHVDEEHTQGYGVLSIPLCSIIKTTVLKDG